MGKFLLKVLNIIFSISVPIIIFLAFYFGVNYIKNGITTNNVEINYGVDEAIVNITVQKDGKVSVSEKLKYIPDGKIDTVYKKIENYSSMFDNIEVYKDNKIIQKKNITRNINLISDAECVYIGETSDPFVLEYKYTLDDISLQIYKDLSILDFQISSDYTKYMKDITINVNLPKSSENFRIYDDNSFGKCSISKLSNSKYTVHKNLNLGGKMFSGYTKLKISFDSSIISSSASSNKKAEVEDIMFNTNENEVVYCVNLILLCILIIVSIYMLFYYIFIKNINKSKENSEQIIYYRDVDNLISPEYASVFFNKKIKIKEFITTVLVILLNNEKVKIVDENELMILDLENVNPLHKEVLKLIFNKDVIEVGMKITLKEINKEFGRETAFDRIKSDIKKINKMVLNYFYENNLYDEYIALHIKGAKQYAFFNILFITLSFLVYIFGMIYEVLEFYNIIYLILILITFLLLILGKWFDFNVDLIYSKIIRKISKNRNRQASLKIELMFASILAIFLFICQLNIVFILSIILLIINIRIFFFHDDQVLTSDGIKEYNKVLGMKKFIEEFSYLNEKEFKDSILWKKYLEYAVAFDISKKITQNVINADLLNLNVAITDIERIIGLFF